LADGQKDPARQYAEKTLALLDSHKAPASSWSDTEQRRGEIRRDAERTLAQATKQPSNETHSIENRFPRREAGCTLRTKRGDIPERALSPTHYLRHGADRQERSDSQCPGYRGVPIRDEAGHYRRPRPSLDLGTSAEVDKPSSVRQSRGSPIGAPAGDGCFAGSSASRVTPIAAKITMSQGLSLLCIPCATACADWIVIVSP
jgi:hypothetical protein